ncbi:MAG: hypothetical protein AMXMBFR64_62800 [Myxococcales bacterium]
MSLSLSLSLSLVLDLALMTAPVMAAAPADDPADEALEADPVTSTGWVLPWSDISGKDEPQAKDPSSSQPVVSPALGANPAWSAPQEVYEEADVSAEGGEPLALLSGGPCDDPWLCRQGQCDVAKLVCRDDRVHHVPYFFIQAWTNYPIEVRTSNLRALAGETEGRPDTVVRLLWCDDASCESGDVIAIDSDGNDETECRSDSKLVVYPPESGYYAVVVSAGCSGSGGIADIRIDANNATYTHSDVVFGGMTVKDVSSKAGDSLFVGKNPNSQSAGYVDDPEYHDSTLWVFSTSDTTCASSCGRFLWNDDALPSAHGHSRLLLSKIDIPQGFPGIRHSVLVGSYAGRRSDEPWWINGRLMRYRRHVAQGGGWSGSAQMDGDGDGLSAELEALLGSCDSPTQGTSNIGVAGMSCGQYATLVNDYRNAKTSRECEPGSSDPYCWTPLDSDNDGIPDDWEVFGGVVQCTHTPVPPYGGVGSCPSKGLHQSWSSCWYYGGCFSLPVSALTDPDPGAYDVYVNSDHWACVGPLCADIHGTGLLDESHRITDDQQAWLPDVWTTDPSTCWDGTSSQSPCPGPNDLRYRARIHVYDGERLEAPDCAPGWETPMGARAGRTFWNYLMDPRRRYTGFFRYGFAGHGGGGQTDGDNPVFTWGNQQDEYATYHALSHEVGHTLGLDHTFKNAAGAEEDCPKPPAPSCPSVSGNCTGGDCVGHVNPQVASLMSYEHKTFLPKSPDLPSGACHAGCEERHGRFSKGLNPDLDEGALVELYSLSDWRTTKRAQDLFCLKDIHAPSVANPAVCGVNCERTYDVTCDANQCRIDWNRNGQPDNGAYSRDLTYGRFDGDPATGCAQDVLVDTNEWLHIMAMGKDALDAVRVPAGEPNRTFTNFHFYTDTFNGDAPANMLAAPLEVTHDVTMDNDSYPRNIAGIGSGCPSGSVRQDQCQADQDCLSGSCDVSTGRCNCSSNKDCRSFSCGASSKCSIDAGACTCSTGTDCPGAGGCSAGECLTTRESDEAPFGSHQRPPYRVATFDGPASTSYVRLANRASQSVTETITANSGFGVLVDLRFDGFAQGQTKQVVASSGSFEIAVALLNGLPKLKVTSGTKEPLVFPGRDVGRALIPGRWYRVRVGLWEGEVFATVTAWNMLTGGYDDTLVASGCIYETWPGALPATGSIWLGADGPTSQHRLRGALDNLTIGNIRVGGAKKPTACAEQ